MCDKLRRYPRILGPKLYKRLRKACFDRRGVLKLREGTPAEHGRIEYRRQWTVALGDSIDLASCASRPVPDFTPLVVANSREQIRKTLFVVAGAGQQKALLVVPQFEI